MIFDSVAVLQPVEYWRDNQSVTSDLIIKFIQEDDGRHGFELLSSPGDSTSVADGTI